MNAYKYIGIILCSLICIQAQAQEKENPLHNLEIAAEAQASISDGTTPLWLNANRYGLSSLESQNGYLRVSAIRQVEADTERNWKWGYGVDIVAGANYDSKAFIHQAFAEMQWKKLRLSLGAKEQPVEYTNQELSSGALTLGCNARPIPQARMDLDWFSIPGTRGWWKWKFHGSFGMTTDGGWQENFVKSDALRTGNIGYHEKALYWKFGKEDPDQFPLTYELALQMATQFAGTSYNLVGRGFSTPTTVKHPLSMSAIWQAATAGGSDETDGSSKNTVGNHIGSWNMRLAWHDYEWEAAVRFERMFEDQSMMFIQYGIYDHLLGLDVTLPQNQFVTNFTIEHMSSYDQSGAILHDQATTIPDKMNGMDNYYNHNIYTGYHHWGQGLGSPLITSPVYNDNGKIYFYNNRVKATHIGITGDPYRWLHWRMLATFTRNWGCYDQPLEDPTNQQYFLLETTAKPLRFNGWQASLALAMDHGKVIGNNYGAQLTIRKTLKIK